MMDSSAYDYDFGQSSDGCHVTVGSTRKDWVSWWVNFVASMGMMEDKFKLV